jgi:hypothetical protein
VQPEHLVRAVQQERLVLAVWQVQAVHQVLVVPTVHQVLQLLLFNSHLEPIRAVRKAEQNLLQQMQILVMHVAEQLLEPELFQLVAAALL